MTTNDACDDAANQLKVIADEPVALVGFGSAGDLIGGLVGPRTFLHGGPPIEPSDTIGAMRGALIGALLLEGESESVEEADTLIDHNEVSIRPCHDVGGVGALAGVVSPSVPIAVVARQDGTNAFAPVIEGLGKALSFGNFDQPTLDRVRWLATEFSDVLNQAFDDHGPLDIIDLQARSLRRGDEGHNRLVAATEKLIVMLAPALLTVGHRALPVLEDLKNNPHFFLTLSMAAAKSVAMAIEESGPPGVVTALAGNGVHAGIRVSGVDREWFLDEAMKPRNMMLVPGRSEDDATPLMGDSGVTETVGLGAFSLSASLALARVLGVNAEGAQQIVDRMRTICITDHPRYLLPADDFRGSPLGISVEAVTRHEIAPAVNAGYAHRVPGEGRVGADVATFPLGLFAEAARTLPHV